MPTTPSRSAPSFRPELFAFLRDLAANNSRDWFLANKERYESAARHPALRFISDFGPHLAKISTHFNADPRPVGGSLFRIHRDVRFSRDKSPYKNHIGIQFRHKQAKDVHAPGFYLHLEPRSVFAGLGIWHPDSKSLQKIRRFIVDNPQRWKRALAGSFGDTYGLEGEALKRPPRGFDAEHPLIEDLKRKDFIGVAHLQQKRVTARGFVEDYAALCRAGTPFMRFLCEAMGVPF